MKNCSLVAQPGKVNQGQWEELIEFSMGMAFIDLVGGVVELNNN